jgi:hypothetical protein
VDYSSAPPTGEPGYSKTNATNGKASVMSTSTTRKPKVIKTFKDYKFQGPLKIALSDLFQNFTYLQIKVRHNTPWIAAFDWLSHVEHELII